MIHPNGELKGTDDWEVGRTLARPGASLRVTQRLALRVEMEMLLAAVCGESRAIVTGAKGQRYLHLAEKLHESGRSGQAIVEPDLQTEV